MNPDQPIYHLALLTLEALSAHGIRSGDADFVQDVVLLRDANGLPALPGTSLAGVLRHLFEREAGEEAGKRLFGFAGSTDGQGSRVHIGWALVHDSHNRAIEGLREDLAEDVVLQELSKPHPIVRQRVRLDARGTAAGTGKFDVSLLPAGTRYSTLIGYWSDGSAEAEGDWQQLLALLHSPLLRIGHSTRAGAGHFVVRSLQAQRWDLRDASERVAYMKRPRTRMEARSLPDCAVSTAHTALSLELDLRSESGWRIGGGDVAIGFEPGDLPDLLPQSEWRIEWQAERGRIGERINLLPATAIKGALLHRFAFHYRCLSKNWVSTEVIEAHQEEAVRSLFGHAGNDRESDEGQAGLMLIEDLFLEGSTVTSQMHNRIDHFTGGVMDGGLFEEGLLWRTPVRLKIVFQHGERLQKIDAASRQALQRTLDDLASGLLPLGAGGSRGQGVFLASDPVQWPAQWSDGGKWIQEGVPA